MKFDAVQVRNSLSNFDFKTLFIGILGWDNCPARSLNVVVDGINFVLEPLAEKRGLVAFVCQPGQDGCVPTYVRRNKIDRQVSKTVHEHIIIYIDKTRSIQIWQWVRRGIGQSLASREHCYYRNSKGDALIQKLQAVHFGIEEEDGLTIVDVAARAKLAFDVERVTKKFYEIYRKEHSAFFKAIKGIDTLEERELYASIIFNRLMFIYFIQKKRFLDNDTNYLKNKLKLVQEQQGKNKFLTFYRYFLLRLFHEGLGSKSRTTELDSLLGKVPYLNGGLFELHEIEQLNNNIEIPDSAFQRVFNFFDAFQWHLDDRPLKADNEINPDILGYIFEKYVNQREMGAYYTKDDITEYMTKSIIIPFLMGSIQKSEGMGQKMLETINDMISEDRDRYILPAMKAGVISIDGTELGVPTEIIDGISHTSNRENWNLPVSAGFGPTTESSREYINRRSYCLEARCTLKSKHLSSISDFITFNLDTRQLAQDIIQGTETPSLLLRAYHIIRSIRVLDPTCGSGAFLFQALNVLEPLYEGCLDQMTKFLRQPTQSKNEDFQRCLKSFQEIHAEIGKHPSYRYFIMKSIILNNLFGVDIMEEATEICKLRLFLKLAAQIEADFSKPNFGLEPLPDIDFNIRSGNALVGFTTYEQVKKSITSGQLKFGSDEILATIQQKAELADKAYEHFRDLQNTPTSDDNVTRSAKRALEERFEDLGAELDRYLAIDYRVELHKKGAFNNWKSTHRPFHWFLEFYAIIRDGGFDIVVGNPPYLELREVNYSPIGFSSEETKAVHAMCIERSLSLLKPSGSISMIVPLSLVSTQRMKVVQELIEKDRTVWYSHYSWRPGRLFDTVNRALTIFVASSQDKNHTYSTNYQRWNSEDRSRLFQILEYTEIPRDRSYFWAPKMGQKIERSILSKLQAAGTVVEAFCSDSEFMIYRKSTGGLYWKVFTDFAPNFKLNGRQSHSSRETSFSLSKSKHLKPLIALLSSDIYWWWYTISTNLRDLNANDIYNFPLPPETLDDPRLSKLGSKYLDDLVANSTPLVRIQKGKGKTETQSFKILRSKPIINQIDDVLAQHYKFTEEELDFIQNYDIKFRMGDTSEDDEDLQ